MVWLAVRLWVGWQVVQVAADRGLGSPVAIVELLAGVALVAGLLTLPAAVGAAVVAGTGSPLMLALALTLVAVGPAAYVYGVDRFLWARLREIRKGPQSADRYGRRLSSGSLSGEGN